MAMEGSASVIECAVNSAFYAEQGLYSKLAKFEARTVIEILARRLPSLELVEGQEIDYFPNITLRGPTELHVTWT